MEDIMQKDAIDSLVATFEVGGRFYGLPTSKVQEVVRVGEITPVHHSPDFILGIMNLRGKIITVVDLSRKIFAKPQSLSNHSRIFIAEWEQEQVGLLVEKVGEVVPFDQSELLAVPENLPAAQAALLQGVFHSGKLLIGLLDVDAILDDSKLSEDRFVPSGEKA